jgi:hypothetical protein
MALYFIYYNFARGHQTLRVTPAMEAGVATHVSSVQEIRSPAGLESLRMLQPALALTGFGFVIALMIWGTLTSSATTKRVLFWTLLLGIASASYVFSRISN